MDLGIQPSLESFHKKKVTPWNQAFLVALADTSSEEFQSFERIDNSNEISQLRSGPRHEEVDGVMDGTGANLRRSTPRSATLHCNRSIVSQVSSRLIPGYIRCTEFVTCFNVLVDVSQFLDSQHCTNGSFILPKTNIVFQKGNDRIPPFAPMQCFANTGEVYRKWKSSTVPGILQCRKRRSTTEVGVSRCGKAWEKVQGVSPKEERGLVVCQKM